MDYLFDKNICIYIIKKKSPALLDKLSGFPFDSISISSITIAELHYGVDKSLFPVKNLFALQKFLTPFNIVDFDYRAAVEYGKIRALLKKKGTPIGPMDMLIAACAKSRGLTLFSNYLKEFSRIESLSLENWV